MPNYTKSGKQLIPISFEQFKEAMLNGHFVREKHRGLVALLYYTAVRITEALRSLREQYQISGQALYFDVGERLKKYHVIRFRNGKKLETPIHTKPKGYTETMPLKIPLSREFADCIKDAVEDTKPRKRVFPYCRATGYNVVARVLTYPHHLRLTRLTDLAKIFGVAQLKSYTALSLPALEFYIGYADIEKMGEV